MMNSEISDDYLERVRADLRRVEFSSGIPMCARLGNGNRSTAYILRDDKPPTASWLDRLLQRMSPDIATNYTRVTKAGRARFRNWGIAVSI